MLRLPRQRLLFDVIAALLLASLLLRGLTPPGYMPGPMGLKLCTAVGLVDASIPDSSHQGSGEGSDHARDLCPFAAAAGTAPPAQNAWHVGLADIAPPGFLADVLHPVARGIQLLPWPRGPPALR